MDADIVQGKEIWPLCKHICDKNDNRCGKRGRDPSRQTSEDKNQGTYEKRSRCSVWYALQMGGGPLSVAQFMRVHPIPSPSSL